MHEAATPGRHRHALAPALAAMLAAAACSPKPPAPPPTPAPPPPAVSASADAGNVVQAAEGSVTSASGAPTTPGPHPTSPPGAEADVPALAKMALAQPGNKLGVPVDLRYSFDEPPQPGRPVTLHLAAVPRVEGASLRVSIKEDPGIDAIAAPISIQKATAGTAYRRQLSVTRTSAGPRELRVLVTMELPDSVVFGYFGVPLESVAGKQPARLE